MSDKGQANTPKTPKEIAKWLAIGRKRFAERQASDRAAAEAAAKAAAAMEAKVIQAAAIRARVRPVAVTPKQVASFLWGPDFKATLSPLSVTFGWLVQTLAQSLISAYLLPPDHPARTLAGAKEFRVVQLIDEARLNLLPSRLLFTKPQSGEPANANIIASRQYVMFASMIGLFVTAGLSIFAGLAQIVLGAAYAYAQTQPTGGTTIGQFALPANGDLGGILLDAIFGTAVGGQSLAMSGLGAMLKIFSSATLVFAGIILLWIIISGVAETARTGIPLGKQFNHIWAPIRLVTALGLLVPLGSGLNSGQSIVIGLSKWGSQQATLVWGTFAEKMIATTGPGQSPGGISNIPLDVSANRNFADQLFRVALCEQIANAGSAKCTAAGGAASCPALVTQHDVGTITIGQTVMNAGPNGVATPPPPSNQPLSVQWYAADAGGNKIPGAADCGGVTVSYPTTANPTGQNASDWAGQAILIDRSNAATGLFASVSPLAQTIAQAAAQAKTDNTGAIALDPTAAFNQYEAAFQTYMTTQTAKLAGTINTYNGKLGNGMTQTAQTYGWMYAPVWLASIAQQNGAVMDAAEVAPTVTAPSPSFGDGTTNDMWSLADSFVEKWEPSNTVVHTSNNNQTFTSIANAIQQMTSDIGSDPLGQMGQYGRFLLTAGFRIIEPPDMIDCYQNPFAHPTQCQFVLTEALMQTANGGTWNGLGAGQVKQMIIDNNYDKGKNGSQTDYSYSSAMGLGSGQTFLPDQSGLPAGLQKVVDLAGDGTSAHTVLFPIGMIMISMGFTMVLLTLLPFTRFILGILNWMIMVFEAVLAAPLVALSFLRTEGEGFMPQQAQTSLLMLLGVIIRPILMTFGLVLGLIAFNAIMQIANLIFAPTIAHLSPTSDTSFLSMGVYMIFYGTLAYTLANSSFKMIDILPNFVMGWIGQRAESRVDDAAMVQQQAQGFMQTMAISSRGQLDPNTAYSQHMSAKAASQYGAGAVGGGGAGGAGPAAAGPAAMQPSAHGGPANLHYGSAQNFVASYVKEPPPPAAGVAGGSAAPAASPAPSGAPPAPAASDPGSGKAGVN